MGSGDDVFADSGPQHMMARRAAAGSSSPTMNKIDWDNDEHRRCIAACLVKGTYVLERDRTKGRRNTPAALAPAWFESFHFLIDETLECDCRVCKIFEGNRRSLIYGAIFKHAPPEGASRHPSAPRYIVAFRGTMPRHRAAFGDFHLDVSIVLNKQHSCRRFCKAREQVGRHYMEKITNGGSATGGSDDVWLTGHSLGASIALDVGRGMATKRCYLPTFLFNPPHVSLAPLYRSLRMSEVAKWDLYVAKCTVKAALGMTFLSSHEKRMEELFQRLQHWVPELFVHERDSICLGFIDYLEERQEMLDRVPPEFRWLAELVMKLSLRDTLTTFHNTDTNSNEGEELEGRVQPHLMPSARLWKNSTKTSGFLGSHSLKQWWKTDGELNLSSRLYSYREVPNEQGESSSTGQGAQV